MKGGTLQEIGIWLSTPPCSNSQIIVLLISSFKQSPHEVEIGKSRKGAEMMEGKTFRPEK